ncbi:MAG: hypothetical protein FWH11_01305 [Micrococcales bacterium]|nr:hypothetical protein [Micrococcales bacterium]
MGISFSGGPKVGGRGVAFGPGAPDPLADVEYGDDLAADSAAELTAMEQAYRDRAKTEETRFRAATDSEFWFAVCFASRAEKDAFLAETGAGALGDKYLDGRALADLLRRRG